MTLPATVFLCSAVEQQLRRQFSGCFEGQGEPAANLAFESESGGPTILQEEGEGSPSAQQFWAELYLSSARALTVVPCNWGRAEVSVDRPAQLPPPRILLVSKSGFFPRAEVSKAFV